MDSFEFYLVNKAKGISQHKREMGPWRKYDASEHDEFFEKL